MYDSMWNFTPSRSVLISNRFDNVYGNRDPKNYYSHHTTIQITIEIERYLTDIFIYRNRFQFWMVPSDRAFNSVSISIRTDLWKSIHRCIPFVTSLVVGGILVEKSIMLAVLLTNANLYDSIHVTLSIPVESIFQQLQNQMFSTKTKHKLRKELKHPILLI